MGKLFLFGIGGTGSRVLRSLTMLLASGVEIDADQIVPVIIDADHSNEDLSRTINLIKRYNSIRDKLTFDNTTQNRFWGTRINATILPELLLPLQKATNNDLFKDYIGVSNMSRENQAIVSMLFSEDNLNAKMRVGFKGNPNMGSVVLNQFTITQKFKDILDHFDDGDRIFIISSIFGGTGASGFPLLAKNLRNLGGNFSKSHIIKDSPIGAITVLPYFDLKSSDTSEIDSSTFVSKTIAALQYYKEHLTETNALYYVSDNITTQYDNHEGGPKQVNNAHIVELISALSIIDFMSISAEKIGTKDGVPQFPIFKEFGMKTRKNEDTGKEEIQEKINFDDLCDVTNNIVRRPLSQFMLFAKYIKYYQDKQPWRDNFDKNFFSQPFFNDLETFIGDTFGWYKELKENYRSFEPFNLEAQKDALFEFVHGINPAKVVSADSNYKLFDNRLNKHVKDAMKAQSAEQQFVELFYRATNQLIKEKLKI